MARKLSLFFLVFAGTFAVVEIVRYVMWAAGL